MKQELKSAFRNKYFYITVFGVWLAFNSTSLVMYFIRIAQGEAEYMSALFQIMTPIFFGAVMILIPFFCTLPYAMSQVDEIRDGFLYQKAMRSSLLTICRNKVLPTMLSGGAALTLAWLLNVLLWHLLSQPYVDSNPMINLPMAENNFYYTFWFSKYAWGVYAFNCFNFFVIGALWSMIALTVAIWLPDRFLTLTIPTGIYFFWWTDPYRFLFPKVPIPDPSSLINEGITWSVYRSTLTLHGILIILCVVLYYFGLKRRLTNA